LDDSKRLSAARRDVLAGALWLYADQVVVLSASSATIDRDGLHVTNLRLMRDALSRLDPRPQVCLVDGFALGADAPDHERVIGGDRKSACIAAASVVAKTTRDRLMTGPAATAYPQFGFEAHVGYSTPDHQVALREGGLSPLHRRSFRSVAYPPLQLFDPATASSSAPAS
jgi:ribonuclease HII